MHLSLIHTGSKCSCHFYNQTVGASALKTFNISSWIESCSMCVYYPTREQLKIGSFEIHNWYVGGAFFSGKGFEMKIFGAREFNFFCLSYSTVAIEFVIFHCWEKHCHDFQKKLLSRRVIGFFKVFKKVF